MQGFLGEMRVGRHQFSRPPIRSYHFWAETLCLLMVAAVALFLTAFFRSLLNGNMALTMSVPFIMLTILWFGVIGVHQAAYELYGRADASSKRNALEDDSRVSILLDKLSFLCFAGFNYAAAATALAYGALVPIALLARR